MKNIIKLSIFSLIFAHTIIAINFMDSDEKNYRLVPFHELDRVRTIDGLYELFQNEKVVKFYERGEKKDKNTCENLFNRVGNRFNNWQFDQLGWTGIINGEEKFIGFIGAFIHKNKEPYHIEIAVAVLPEFQQKKIISSGLISYFRAFWPKLNDDVKNKTTCIISPINPRNLPSLGLSEHFFKNSINKEEVFIPDFYKGIEKEKGERVNSVIPIEPLLKLLEQTTL